MRNGIGVYTRADNSTVDLLYENDYLKEYNNLMVSTKKCILFL